MTIKITPRLIELTYDALLKSFWRRIALRKFLIASHIASSFLDTWHVDESKRELLDRLFLKLQSSEKGNAVIRQMALSLCEQKTFPDLKNWEDSELKIKEAKNAVQSLQIYIKEQEEQIKSETERKTAIEKARIEKQAIQRAQLDKQKLQSALDSMHSLVGTQSGGYQFETWFYDLLDFCEITNRRPYKTDGRQIDGSLTYEGTTYLVELKFTKEQSGAPDIDIFKAKINKMADNTMGLMVSISSYSSVAISEASGSKTPVLLMDAMHLYSFLTGAMSFTDILSRVRRHASQTGDAYLPINKFNG